MKWADKVAGATAHTWAVWKMSGDRNLKRFFSSLAAEIKSLILGGVDVPPMTIDVRRAFTQAQHIAHSKSF